MSTFLSILWPFLFNWLVLLAVCYAVVEFGQSYFYDETTPGAPLKVALGSAILAAILTWTRTSYDTMLTRDIGKTVVLAIAAFGVFTLIFRFQPWHGFAVGIASVLLVAGFATMGVDSFVNRNRPLSPTVTTPAKPLRRAATTVPLAPARSPEKPAAR